MAKDDRHAGDGAAEGDIRHDRRSDRGKRYRRLNDDSASSEGSESSAERDSGRRRKRERESDRDYKRKKREREDRRSGGSSKRKRGSRRRGGSDTGSEEEDSYSSSSSGSESESDSDSAKGTESEGKNERPEEIDCEARRKRRRERRRREEKDRRRKKEKERERRRREKEKERKRRKEKEKEKKRKKKEKDTGKTGAVTNNWGKYGIIREIDMWNKRPEFTAWLLEVKQVNMESLANWEEKQMFKEFMEDHNTATFPSKKYYDLDAYHRHKMTKQMMKGLKEAPQTERTIFDDEEQKRQELLKAREKMKEEQVEALKRSMQSGMAQAMKEQALLREEMQLQYKLGNFEAAAAIQRRLDPDVAM